MGVRILFLLAVPALAAERTHTVVPEDYFSLATITEVAVSPDGKHVAFAEARWSKEDDLRKADLWVIATDGKSKPVRLTFDRANEHHVKWSADGKTIYALANRKRSAETKAPYDGKTQVWAMPVTGGEPRAITREPGGIDDYDYSPKANTLFYSVTVDTSDEDDFARLRAKYKLDYGHGVRKVSEIWKLNLDDWRAAKVYAGKRYVRSIAATQDGTKLAMVTAFDDSVVKSEGESRVDIATGERGASAPWSVTTPNTDAYRKNAASPNAWLENLSWNPSGSRFAVTAVFDGYPAMQFIGTFNSDWTISAMPFDENNQVSGYGRSSGEFNQWISDDILFFVSEQAGYSTIGVYGADTRKYFKEIQSEGHIYGYHLANVTSRLSEDAKLEGIKVNLAAIVAKPGEMAVMSRVSNNQSIAYDANQFVGNWKQPRISHISWTAPDGSKVGGVLEIPPGYDGKSKLPLVVAIHGGPTTSSKAALEFDPHNGRMYFSTAGYAVLCPNYRGSTGYGDKFVTDLIGRENDIEVKDIIAGVEHLVKEGIADPERVGVMGWSNGGYLTNCLITRKDLPFKLKAASSGAGIVDTVAEWGFNDEPAYPKVFKKGHPWETPDIYKKTSPTYDLANIKTPTIIHVGGNDVRCPPGHSRMLYRAMKEYLNVPCELCEYPGEPHGLTKMTHRRAKMEWDLAWFNKYMK